MKTIVVDNGGGFVRGGYAGQSEPRRSLPNAIAKSKRGDKKIYVGEKILNSPIAEYLFFRPSQRGLLCDLESQKFIWEHGLFVREKLTGSFTVLPDAETSTIVLTISSFTPEPVRRDVFDVLFHDYRFHRVAFIDSSICAQFSPGITSHFTQDDWANPCGLLVDIGFSFTTIIPVFNTQPIAKASQRVPVGARVLNNLLKERLAYLQVDLDDNPLLIQHIRESVCQVAPISLKNSLTNFSTIGYVLPEFSGEPPHVGRVVENAQQVPEGAQAVKIGPDQFTIPEALFNPQSFGIDSLGIVEAIFRSINLCDESIRKCLAKKIIVFGGTAMTPGCLARLENELTSATHYPVRIITEQDGRLDLSVWRGAAQIASNDDDLAYFETIYREDWSR
jgi:actin-related protein 6